MSSTHTVGPRALSAIAAEIRQSWPKMAETPKPGPFGPVVHPARPYLDAMATLETADDSYGMDDGRDIVLRFIGNASGWRGEDARRIKAELRAVIA